MKHIYKLYEKVDENDEIFLLFEFILLYRLLIEFKLLSILKLVFIFDRINLLSGVFICSIPSIELTILCVLYPFLLFSISVLRFVLLELVAFLFSSFVFVFDIEIEIEIGVNCKLSLS